MSYFSSVMIINTLSMVSDTMERLGGTDMPPKVLKSVVISPSNIINSELMCIVLASTSALGLF